MRVRIRPLLEASAEAILLVAGPLAAAAILGGIPDVRILSPSVWDSSLRVSAAGAALAAATAARALAREGGEADAMLRAASIGLAALSILTALGLGDPLSAGRSVLSVAVGGRTVRVEVDLSVPALVALAAAAVGIADAAAEAIAARAGAGAAAD